MGTVIPTRNPAKAACDKQMIKLLQKLVKEKDHYTSLVWEENAFKVTTLSGKTYRVTKSGFDKISSV